MAAYQMYASHQQPKSSGNFIFAGNKMASFALQCIELSWVKTVEATISSFLPLGCYTDATMVDINFI